MEENATKNQNVNNKFQLTSITEITELYKLRDLYLRDWPQHCVGYYCIDNFIRWLQYQPDLKNLQIYTLNGDWKTNNNGLCLIVHRYQLFINCLNHSDVDNSKLYIALSLLDWSKGLKVSNMPERYRKVLLKVIDDKHLKKEYDSLTLMYYMPKEQALQLNLNCPNDYMVHKLSVDDAKTIDDAWPNRHDGSLFLVKHLIGWNANMGVYTRRDNELVAWCLRLQSGFLGALQTKNTHKRLGLGTVVTVAISHEIAKIGHDVMALVGDENMPSRKIFENLGFQIRDRCYWIRTYPTIENFKWSDDM